METGWFHLVFVYVLCFVCFDESMFPAQSSLFFGCSVCCCLALVIVVRVVVVEVVVVVVVVVVALVLKGI